jgi:hypothetical protein
MMYQPIENTAYCLNCANEWPAVWDRKELTLACPGCRWRLSVPIEFVSSGWWTTREYDGDTDSTEAGGAGEEHREKRWHERAEFSRDVRKDLERLPVIGPPRSRGSRGWPGKRATG